MNYNEYLQLDKILKSDTESSVTNDELLFIVAHQTTELWFKVLIQELNSTNKVNLKRITKIIHHLTTVWEIISTIDVKEYNETIRPKLDTASGLQSVQYKEMHKLLQNLTDTKLGTISGARPTLDKEELADLEYTFKQWQFSHMKTVERIIDEQPGTGGTSGVQYLRHRLNEPLWRK